MASIASKSATVKQLKEHLQEPQEPFTLNIYLSERGYLVKCLSSNGRNGCCQHNLFKNLNKKMGLLSERIVKSIAFKLVSSNDSQELWCCSEFQTKETSGCSEVKGATLFGASPLRSMFKPAGCPRRTSQASNIGDEEQEKVLTDETCRSKCGGDKQLNGLMSMFNKLSSDKLHQIITKHESSYPLNANARGNFTFTTNFPLGKSVFQRCSFIRLKEAKRNKEVVNQTQASNEFVRNIYNYIHCFIDMQKKGNLINAQQIYPFTFRKSYSTMDFSDTLKEWKFSQTKIGFQLGDSIMEEIIEEMVDSLQHCH